MDPIEAVNWRTSSYSGGNNECVEVADRRDGGRLVRDTKDRAGGTLRIGAGAWAEFLDGVRAGEFG